MGSVSEWGTLSKSELIAKCGHLALEAERLARTAPPDLRKYYNDVAQHWHRLAAEIELTR